MALSSRDVYLLDGKYFFKNGWRYRKAFGPHGRERFAYHAHPERLRRLHGPKEFAVQMPGNQFAIHRFFNRVSDSLGHNRRAHFLGRTEGPANDIHRRAGPGAVLDSDNFGPGGQSFQAIPNGILPLCTSCRKLNRLAKFLETFERLSLPLQRKYLGEPLRLLRHAYRAP